MSHMITYKHKTLTVSLVYILKVVAFLYIKFNGLDLNEKPCLAHL